MEKLQRNERIAALIKILSDQPNQLFTFNYFVENFNCAKSTLSEDVELLKGIVEKFELGTIETVSGAAGGVKYIPVLGKEKVKTIVSNLCNSLSDSNRILSGGFLYMTDIIYNPTVVDNIGKIFAGQFINDDIDYVVTVETKGIPISMMTARYLNVPLIIVRRDSKVTEGSSVNINYVSASSRRIQTMSLSRRAIKKNSKVLFVDDFMKGGGTARGIIELMKEFESTVEGIAVLISTKEPSKKFINEYFSLMILNDVDEQQNIIDLKPGIKLD
ncbi:MAG: purine operon repressor [Petroclostridium sp.]|jgi:purine operon repressor|uniref:pur operon repressor n=1 Tax=Petroclostridium xylanilyticum TaxID=1792311 RepID=UPI000B9834D3|nr:pur operon repressor [Petroclostridium xylanilyticum]MBZ4645071.1 purine operon repressor, PurR [Clostridia bacterium]MDK2810017.1 purine operon repressor [Petroclostridium sp.]